MTRKCLAAITTLSGLTMAIALTIYFLPVPFCRYMCDDFVNAAITKSQGILGGIRYMYSYLAARFSTITLYNLYDALGLAAVPWTPVLGLLAMLAALAWTLLQVMPRRPGRFQAALLISGLFLMAFLQMVPNLFQLLYWPAALLTYLSPIIGITLLAGCTIRIVRRGSVPSRHPWRERAVLWPAVLLVAGFTETYAVLMLAALGLGLLASLLLRQGRGQRLMIGLGAAAMTVLGLLIQVTASALTKRGDLKAVDLAPPAVIIASMKYGGELFISLLSNNLIPLLSMLLVVSFLYSRFQSGEESATPPLGQVLSRVGLAATAFFLVMTATMTPSFQALGRPPYNRVLTAPVWGFASLWLVVGVLLAPLWLQRSDSRSPRLRGLIRIVLVVAAFWGMLATAWGSLRQVHEYLPGMRRYALAWDERDQAIRKQLSEGKRDVLVNALPATWFILDGGAREVGPNPELWLNQSVAQFYGADSLVTPAQAARSRPRRKALRRKQQTVARQ